MKYRLPDDGSSNRAPAGRPRPLTPILLGYSCVLVVVLVTGSFLGELELAPAEVWQSWRSSDPALFQTWVQLRLEPLLFAAAAGAALALAGTVFQAALRNPLAEPYILGVSGGASLGVMLAQILAPALGWSVLLVGSGGGVSETALTLGALSGAVAAVALLLGVARWAGLFDPASLILAGAVLNAIFGALILLLYSLAPAQQVVTSLVWLMGSTSVDVTADTHALRNTTILLVAGGGVLFLFARSFDLLSLGEDEAADLGIEPRRFRILALVIASILTGTIVAVSGPIGFIGLVVPHVVRRIHGPLHRRLIPLAMVAGAIFLMLAHVVSRNVFPTVIPIGAVTALVGGPFFLFLLGGQRLGGRR